MVWALFYFFLDGQISTTLKLKRSVEKKNRDAEKKIKIWVQPSRKYSKLNTKWELSVNKAKAEGLTTCLLAVGDIVDFVASLSKQCISQFV